LKLFYCQIVIQSSSVAAQQNLRHLDLCFWTIQRLCLGRPSSLAQMLCGSLLQHVTFDFRDFTERLATEFFATLSMNSSAVQLRSMHLMGCLLWDMSLYLSSTLYLRHFTFTFIQSRDHGEFYVPSTFLRSLRQNASLHTVEFKSWHGQSYTLSDSVSRFIQAYTTRNRELSNLTKSCFSAAANSAESNMSGTTGTSNRCGNDAASPRKKRFPTLCLVSQQAERMAPNSLLQGLLASSDALATASGSHHLGKRVAGEALKDI
jgi:hypothetical protein